MDCVYVNGFTVWWSLCLFCLKMCKSMTKLLKIENSQRRLKTLSRDVMYNMRDWKLVFKKNKNEVFKF